MTTDSASSDQPSAHAPAPAAAGRGRPSSRKGKPNQPRKSRNSARPNPAQAPSGPATTPVSIRVTPIDRARLEAMAAAEDKTLSAWARDVLLDHTPGSNAAPGPPESAPADRAPGAAPQGASASVASLLQGIQAELESLKHSQQSVNESIRLQALNAAAEKQLNTSFNEGLFRLFIKLENRFDRYDQLIYALQRPFVEAFAQQSTRPPVTRTLD